MLESRGRDAVQAAGAGSISTILFDLSHRACTGLALTFEKTSVPSKTVPGPK